MDLMTLFAIMVFSIAWLFWELANPREPLARMFFGILMLMGGCIGFFSFLLRMIR